MSYLQLVMIVVADVGGGHGIFGLGFEFGGIGDMSLAYDADSGVNRRRSCDGFGLSDSLQGLEGVDLGPLEDGGQVLLLGLHDQLGLGTGLRVDRREGAFLPLDLGPV